MARESCPNYHVSEHMGKVVVWRIRLERGKTTPSNGGKGFVMYVELGDNDPRAKDAKREGNEMKLRTRQSSLFLMMSN